jgi:hypothetical protein
MKKRAFLAPIAFLIPTLFGGNAGAAAQPPPGDESEPISADAGQHAGVSPGTFFISNADGQIYDAYMQHVSHSSHSSHASHASHVSSGHASHSSHSSHSSHVSGA